MKYILILLFVGVMLNLTGGEIEERNNLGFLGGELNRSGVGYRYWYEEYGFQLSGMLLAGQDKKPDYYDQHEGDYFAWGRELKANFGISLMKTLKKNNLSRFYAFVGYGFYHRERKRWASDYPNMNYATEEGYQITNRHYGGVGVGIDFRILEYFRGFVEIPITFKSNYEITMYVPQVGIFYKF